MLRRIARPALAALTALAVAVPALAAQTPQAILERYNKAVDPQGKIGSIEGIKTSITMEMPAMGMNLTVNSAARRPNQIIVDTEIPGMGTMRQGYDGTTAWAMDPMQGPRILTGMEAAALIEGSSFNSMTRSPDLFSAMEPAGTADVGGDAATCVKFTWKSGRETTDCFSNASGLLTRSVSKQVTQAGEVEVEMLMKDYRNINGLMMPHRMESAMMGMQMIITTTSVEFTAPAAALFELPAEIKALKP
jgi:hypothetical protein